MPLRTVSVASGKVQRRVTCERCGCEFEYVVRRFGLGVGQLGLFSSSKAADDDLDSALAKADAAVACPDCGQYQDRMIRRLRWTWLKRTAALAAFVGVIAVFLGVLAGSGPRAHRDVILTVRGVFLAVGVPVVILAAVMIGLDDPSRLGPMRALHRQKARRLRPGRPAG